jgi:hypothetical protein
MARPAGWTSTSVLVKSVSRADEDVQNQGHVPRDLDRLVEDGSGEAQDVVAGLGRALVDRPDAVERRGQHDPAAEGG